MKKTGRKFDGGGRSLSEQKQKVLRCRLETFKRLRSSTLDEIVHQLRTNYKDYHRIKLQSFTKFVQQTLDSPSFKLSKTLIHVSDLEDDQEDEEVGHINSKRRRKANKMEERLQRMETAHVRRIRQSNGDRPSSDDDDEEDEDGAVSTSDSDDAIYSERVEPEFDVMKSSLRALYMGSSSALKPKAAEEKKEKNVEIELPGREKVELMSENGGRGGQETCREAEAKGSVSREVEVKGSEGPMFRDLGGMEKVIEELKMEVIVPLRHPELPRWLGVRPMSGILLYGPPGCGKTKLAHAIANETGIPFYKILLHIFI